MDRQSRRGFLKMTGAAALAAAVPSRVWGGAAVSIDEVIEQAGKKQI